MLLWTEARMVVLAYPHVIFVYLLFPKEPCVRCGDLALSYCLFKRGEKSAVAVTVVCCHALPWRETDTHGSFAVEADLPRWSAHDD